MRVEWTFDRIWASLDAALLLAVASLLALCWWQNGSRFSVPDPDKVRAQPRDFRDRPTFRKQAPLRVNVVESQPVSLTQSRMSMIAREMAESGWDGVPAMPVADMRERNGYYDILFALPDNLDPGSVKVSTSGNVLTLFVNGSGSPASTFVKRFFIPGGTERLGAVETSVSNDIVRVRVRQSGD